MDRIELADGGWIELRDPTDLSEGDRQDIVLAMAETPRTSALRQDFALSNAIQIALISDWNIPYLDDPREIPATNPARVRQLKIADAQQLGPFVRKAHKLLFPPVSTVDDYEDPASPTEPAND